MTEKDRFSGDWLIVEYVYDPDGTFRGEVAQRRIVEQAGDGRLLVTQVCQPSPQLADHPMAAFAGEWVFDLETAGDQRRYLGPDVVGVGTVWQPGALTGQGLWPRFGYEFESYSVLVASDRQLTGGFFSLAGRSVADIVGVAVPEASGIEPRLDLSAPPPDPGGQWTQHRAVGPMLVATDWPSPSQRRRLWAMQDPIGATGIEITEVVDDGNRSVSVVVG
ncbi:hypothetical protein [Candidatus Poriferisocius sp.]|uniref:hypothetical protein n=1 Tax=Candidatus Poriferisocius sp. TaxID=3101276 RepID=UPI003B0180F0